jgi:transposase
MEYYWMIRRMSNKFDYRLKLVQYAQSHSISAAAREFKTTRPTVRKWLYRYEKEGLEGLRDRTRSPHHIPHKMTEEEEDRIEDLRKQHKRWGAIHLKSRYKLGRSHTAIHRVIRQKGLIKKKKKRWRKRKDLRELKAKYKAFEKNQIDVKDLSDIYHYWPFMRGLKLPRYEYTFRELSLGAVFFAYADENNSTYASLFAKYVAEHLRSYGVNTAKIAWQTDNGTEFVGNVRKKINRPSAFEKTMRRYGIYHGRIPPRSSYLQGDVETFHRIVEDELYDIENYAEPIEFLGKAYAYQLYFNYIRENRWRDNKSPLQLLREKATHLDEGILNLPPIRLEILLDEELKGGYDVPGSVH